MDSIVFEDITPDEKGNWLNQSNSDFEKLMPLANRQTKLAKRVEDEQAVFGLYSLALSPIETSGCTTLTNNDLNEKVSLFCSMNYKKK